MPSTRSEDKTALNEAIKEAEGKAESKDGTITIPAQSAGFYHI